MPTRRCARCRRRRRTRRWRRCASACGTCCCAAPGVLLFTAAAIGASAAFNWPPRVHGLVISATLFLLVLRLSWIAVSIVLSPRRPRLRLVPVASAKARWLAAALMAAMVLLAVGRFVPPIVEDGAVQARHLASALRLAAYSAAALLLFVACFAFFGKRAGGANAASARAPLFPRSFPLALLVVAVYAVWLLNAGGAAAAATAAVTLALLLGLRDMVLFLLAQRGRSGGRARRAARHRAVARALRRRAAGRRRRRAGARHPARVAGGIGQPLGAHRPAPARRGGARAARARRLDRGAQRGRPAPRAHRARRPAPAARTRARACSPCCRCCASPPRCCCWCCWC